MALQDWIHKYPQVQRLLDMGEDALEYHADEGKRATAETAIEDDDLYQDGIRAAVREAIARTLAGQIASDLEALAERYTIHAATGDDLDTLGAEYGVRREP